MGEYSPDLDTKIKPIVWMTKFSLACFNSTCFICLHVCMKKHDKTSLFNKWTNCHGGHVLVMLKYDKCIVKQ